MIGNISDSFSVEIPQCAPSADVLRAKLTDAEGNSTTTPLIRLSARPVRALREDTIKNSLRQVETQHLSPILRNRRRALPSRLGVCLLTVIESLLPLFLSSFTH